MLDGCHSSCKCFVLLVGTHLTAFNAPEVSPMLHQVRSLKDAQLFHVGWLPTHEIDVFAAHWSKESFCVTMIISTLQCTKSEFCALTNPCNPKQRAFVFHSCDIEWISIHYLHKKWWLIFQRTDWQKFCGWLFLIMITFVDGLFVMLFKCSPGFDSWCRPDNWASIP